MSPILDLYTWKLVSNHFLLPNFVLTIILVIILCFKFTKVHTNPVLICFLSILYYKDLDEDLERYKTEQNILLRKDKQSDVENNWMLLRKSNTQTKLAGIRCYNRNIVNMWHLLIRLHVNKELIQYRKYKLTSITPSTDTSTKTSQLL